MKFSTTLLAGALLAVLGTAQASPRKKPSSSAPS
jgi:hypothetical protein